VAVTEYYGTGRRKSSTARVFLRPGSGTITINRRAFDDAFPTEALRTQIKTPLVLTENADKYDVLNGDLRKTLKKDGLLTRDARIKERKKYGLAGARKRFQFSKR
jgi:small subunit ribosomal protein S9